MNNHTFGEIFESDAPRRSRPMRTASQARPSYNEDLIATRIGSERDDGDAHPSTFPCFTFLQDAGILDDFLLLIQRVGLTSYMEDESEQYAMLTKTFVESFVFTNTPYQSIVSFIIYNLPFTMPLERFCSIIGIGVTGTVKKIQGDPLICWNSIEV